MKIVMCGGGTGGHINPALAIADELMSQYPDSRILFIGTKKGLESTLVPKAGYDIRYVDVSYFKRRLTPRNIVSAVKAVTSVGQAKKILREFQPDVAIGTGGYVSWPAIKAASKLGIPAMIHEQNAYPGVTTKMLLKYVDKMAISYRECLSFIDNIDQSKIVLTGNPVRKSNITRTEARKKLGLSADDIYILSYGGSQGAHTINKVIGQVIRDYCIPEGVRISHATGRTDFDEFMTYAKENSFESYPFIEVSDYFYDIMVKQAAADIVVCRAGALTIAELSRIGTAAIFVPYPHAAEDHQYKNAAVLADAGAGVIFKDDELTSEKLIAKIKELSADKAKRMKMSEAIRKFDYGNAVGRIAKEAVKIAKK